MKLSKASSAQVCCATALAALMSSGCSLPSAEFQVFNTEPESTAYRSKSPVKARLALDGTNRYFVVSPELRRRPMLAAYPVYYRLATIAGELSTGPTPSGTVALIYKGHNELFRVSSVKETREANDRYRLTVEARSPDRRIVVYLTGPIAGEAQPLKDIVRWYLRR